MALSPEVDVLDVVGGGLEVAGGIVTLGDEDVVVDTALERLVEWDWWALGGVSCFFVGLKADTYHELLLDPAEALEAGCELQVVVCVGLCHCGNDGDVVTLGAYVVCRRDHGDVDIFKMVSLSIKIISGSILTILPSDLRLGNNKLARVAVVGALDWVVQDANRLEDVANNLDLAREIRWVSKNLLGLGAEGHSITLISTLLHGCLNTNSLVSVICNLIKVGVEHVSATVDSGQTSKSLGKLTKTVKRVDVWGLSIASNRVTVETDTLDGLWCSSCRGNVVICCV